MYLLAALVDGDVVVAGGNQLVVVGPLAGNQDILLEDQNFIDMRAVEDLLWILDARAKYIQDQLLLDLSFVALHTILFNVLNVGEKSIALIK